RQGEDESAAAARLALEAQGPLVGLHDAAGDSEAETGAALVAAAAHVGEFVEDARLLRRCDASAGVAHGDFRLLRLRAIPDADRDAAARRGELDRIAEQVDEDLLDAFGVKL